MQTMVANDIEASENKRKYDEQCKKVLSNKYILANILTKSRKSPTSNA